jgi:hypothetical protein
VHLPTLAGFATGKVWDHNNSYEEKRAERPNDWGPVAKKFMDTLAASVSTFMLEADYKKRGGNAPRLDKPVARGCGLCMHPSPAVAGTMATNEFTTCLSSAEHLIVTPAVEVSA